MRDISNKLHALVDEFVGKLSSECDSLANNISCEVHPYVATDSATADPKTPRPSNRTTSEVLNGLKRPSIAPPTGSNHREGVHNVQQAKPKLQAGHSKNREEDRNLRHMKDMKAKSVALQVFNDLINPKSADTDIEEISSRDEENRGGRTSRKFTKGRANQAVELLSSDSASDDSARPRAKYAPRSMGTQPATKGRAFTVKGRTRTKLTRSRSRSPESSQSTDYSYEEDTPSIGGASPPGDTTFPKLRWPLDIGGSNEDGGAGNKHDNGDVHRGKENQNMHEGKNADLDVSLAEDDESNGEDNGRDPILPESEGEELPVLPKVPVKRKVQNEPRASERRTQRGRTKSGSPQIKKQRTPQIDASVITQLQFDKRPPNCVGLPTSRVRFSFIVSVTYVKVTAVGPASTLKACELMYRWFSTFVLQSPIRVRVKVWVLHPQYEGKVVAEAYAGINHKSRCLNDEQDLCRKGEQMISVIRVFYKDTPVMFKKDGRYPKHISFLDQAEGLPNSPILWGVCWIMQIPSMEEITRMMGNVTSSVCGRASSKALEEGAKEKRTYSTISKSESIEDERLLVSVQPRKKTEQSRSFSKKVT